MKFELVMYDEDGIEYSLQEVKITIENNTRYFTFVPSDREKTAVDMAGDAKIEDLYDFCKIGEIK